MHNYSRVNVSIFKFVFVVNLPLQLTVDIWNKKCIHSASDFLKYIKMSNCIYLLKKCNFTNISLTPQNLSIEICIKKIVSICIYVKIALTKKKKKKKF